jgi:hypothetical protein
MRTRSLLAALSVTVSLGLTTGSALAADPAPAATPPGQPAATPKATTSAAQPGHVPGTILLTVFLRHDQSKNLTQINDELWKNGYFDQFPPEGVEVVSWYVVMNIGQIVTLRLPAEKLREVNVVLERTAWGPYRTDFHPTYDYKQLAEQQRQQMRARKK